jgi:serine/threonine protein kinase
VTYLCPACHRSVVVAVGAAELRCPGCALVASLSRVGTAPGVATPLAVDRAGSELAGYALGDRLGAGGMGTVYRATAPDGAKVAVKLLHPDAARAGGDLAERLRREGEALRRLVHPRVVRFVDVGEVDGLPYLVTELVDGQDLATVMAARRVPVAEAAAILAAVCDGVAAAHAQGIVHRDLKPANVLLAGDGTVKVVDFGLAQLGGDPLVATLTRTDVAMGTINYLAPEQRRSAKAVDARADVFALGVIFYELVTGELPLGRFPLPSERGLPRACDAIVRRALDPDPERRYPTVVALAADLRSLAAPPARRTARIAAAIAAAAGLAGAVAYGMAGSPTTTSSPAGSAGSAPPASAKMPVSREPTPAAKPPPDAAPPDAAPPDARVVTPASTSRKPTPPSKPSKTSKAKVDKKPSGAPMKDRRAPGKAKPTP